MNANIFNYLNTIIENINKHKKKALLTTINLTYPKILTI